MLRRLMQPSGKRTPLRRRCTGRRSVHPVAQGVARLVVADRGSGVAGERERIFEPFIVRRVRRRAMAAWA
jgi:hypothetical protein